MNPDFSILKTIRKAATTGIAFIVAFIVAVQGADIPEGLEADTITPGVIVALILALVRAADNVRKQRN